MKLVIDASVALKWLFGDASREPDLARVMADAPICGFGQAAPNLLRCVIKYFPKDRA